MVPFSEIENFSAQWGVPLETVEKDYCLTWLLIGIARFEGPVPFVFYGGTAIKKVYIPDYRFSEDLDFIVTEKEFFDRVKIEAFFHQVFEWVARAANIHCDINHELSMCTEHRFQCFITYDGFAQTGFVAKQIKTDFLYGYDQVIPPCMKKVLSGYSDIQGEEGAGISVYALEAILSDKFAAVLDSGRNEPRDIYDIWQLLKREDLDHALVKKSFKQRFGYEPGLAVLKPYITNMFYSSRWKTRLSHQIVGLPEFGPVRDEIMMLMEGF